MNPDNGNSSWLIVARVFESALSAIRPPFMKLLVVLVFALLIAIGLLREQTDRNVGVWIFLACVVVFAIMAALIQYVEWKFQYGQRTQDSLKKSLRELAQERLESDRVDSKPRLE